MSLNDKIREYLLNNPPLLRSKYADTAKKFGTKTAFGNLKIAREWNWCSEQCEYLFKFLK